jgi:hypothetical protein
MRIKCQWENTLLCEQTAQRGQTNIELINLIINHNK